MSEIYPFWPGPQKTSLVINKECMSGQLNQIPSEPAGQTAGQTAEVAKLLRGFNQRKQSKKLVINQERMSVKLSQIPSAPAGQTAAVAALLRGFDRGRKPEDGLI
jgi:hypothetical protein